MPRNKDIYHDAGMEPATNNPKELEGAKKPARCNVPLTSLAALHDAHNNGASKYGHMNWRKEGVDTKTYVSAAHRHIEAWLGGEHGETDSVTGVYVPHLGAAMACMSILHDAEAQGKLTKNYGVPEVLEKVGGKLSNAAAVRGETWAEKQQRVRDMGL